MAENNKNGFTDAVNSRLGEFFGDEGKSEVISTPETSVSSEESEFLNLKAIVLSIEWEITDEIMVRLLAETDRLIKVYPDKKVAVALLKLLGSVGKYINAKKANALPDSIKLLHSVHTNLQKIVASSTITEAQSNKILAAEIAKFKNLKQQLTAKIQPPSKMEQKPIVETEPARTKNGMIPEEPKPPETAPQVDVAPPDSPKTGEALLAQDTIIHAIEDLKELIIKELKALREELKLLRP